MTAEDRIDRSALIDQRLAAGHPHQYPVYASKHRPILWLHSAPTCSFICGDSGTYDVRTRPPYSSNIQTAPKPQGTKLWKHTRFSTYFPSWPNPFPRPASPFQTRWGKSPKHSGRCFPTSPTNSRRACVTVGRDRSGGFRAISRSSEDGVEMAFDCPSESNLADAVSCVFFVEPHPMYRC